MEAVKLSDSRASGGGKSTRRCTLSAISEEKMGTHGQPEYILVSKQSLTLIGV